MWRASSCRVRRSGPPQLGDLHRNEVGGLVDHGDVLLVEVEEGSAQRLARFMEASLDRAGARAKLVGDLRVREAGEVEEGNGLTLAGGELCDGGPDTGRQLQRFDPL